MRLLIVLFLSTSIILDAQISGPPPSKYSIEDYKSSMTFEPLIANPYEARIGFIGQPSEERLRMDIGASFDLFDLGDFSTFGVDMMTYTRLRSEGRFKFPVETTDYYFGVNFSFNFENQLLTAKHSNSYEQLRIRLAHISSHLIDGYTVNNEFITDPFVYSREFLEVVYRFNLFDNYEYMKISPYFGVNYIFSKIPKSIEPFEFMGGIELEWEIEGNFNFEGGYNYALRGIDKDYSEVHSGQLGIKYNFSKNRAIFLGIYVHNGLSMHGMFFNQKDSYIGIGTQVYYF